MPENHQLALGLDELRKTEALVDDLHSGCCEPLRSPRMESLAATLRSAQSELGELDRKPDAAGRVVPLLEEAGAQLGYLQVACCSPTRTKLYTEALERLNRTQRLVKRTHDMEH
ncbi:hypothetical protein BH23ACT4_BH23ACT4_16330 [soil metagenome]